MLYHQNEIFTHLKLQLQKEIFSNKNIISKCKEYKQNLKDSSLKNKIILIENADPGYDFIFNKKISLV